jgi:virulence factor Mce-like protein
MSRTVPTPGRRVRRRRTETPSRRSVLVKGLATLGVIAAFLAFAVTAIKGVPGRDYTTMYVNAPETGSLRGHDKVAIGGVRVGQVVRITPRANGARVQLQLEPGLSLPRDTEVRVRANGLLGARYVQLIPGSDRSALAEGSTITAAKDALTASVPDALDVFDAQTRGQLGVAISGLGRGLLGNGEPLNDAIRVASDATLPFSDILDSISANAPERLIPGLDSAMVPLAGSRADLRRLLGPAAVALRPFADERDALRATLDVAPSSLSTAAAGLDHGTRLLTAADALTRAVHRTLPTAPSGLRQASALLRDARTDTGGGSPLERTASLLGAAEPAVPAVLKLTDALKPLLPRADDGLGSLSPMVQHVGRYGCDVINTAVTLRSMTGFVGTGTGPNGPSSQFRLQAVAGVEALGVKETKARRDAYFPPCKYLAHEFAVTPLTNLGGTP